jgi:chemotaxis protein MotB
MRVRLIVPGMIALLLQSGCAYVDKIRKSDDLEREVANLRVKVLELQQQKDACLNKQQVISVEKERKISELEQARLNLEQSLKKEISEYKARLEMTERGLEVSFVSEIFFDPGKERVKKQGEETLRKVSEVLNKDVPASNVAVEGYTDNDPIQYSGWKSNWELSCARSLAVLHFLVNEGKVRPQRLSAVGYGEFRNVAPNDSPENKQKNRRVEIVILPAQAGKAKSE